MGKFTLAMSAVVLAALAGGAGYGLGRAQSMLGDLDCKWLRVGTPPSGPTMASTPVTTDTPIAPDRARGLSAPVDQLARDAFGNAAKQFIEVERPTFRGLTPPGAPLFSLLFATEPRSAGDPGLCQATVASVRTGKSDDDGGPPITTWTAYKAVSPLSPRDKWDDAYASSLALSCSRAGRVIPTEDADFGQVGFFSVEYPSDLRAWFAARSVEVALEAFRKAPTQVQCKDMHANDGLAGSCILAALPTSALRMDRLMSITMERGCVGGSGNCYTVKSEFLRSAHFNEQNTWELSFNAYLAGSPTINDVGHTDNLKLMSGTRIID